uniref:Uncharacterized protein n=1 Tax=Vibrio alginolyticus TaxID=663 RepID=A0A510BNW7_VIBAL|nr:hypothetical protein [Vibrio alginolyticus]
MLLGDFDPAEKVLLLDDFDPAEKALLLGDFDPAEKVLLLDDFDPTEKVLLLGGRLTSARQHLTTARFFVFLAGYSGYYRMFRQC